MICPTVSSQEHLFILLLQIFPIYSVKRGSCFTAADMWLHHLVGSRHCLYRRAAFMSLLLILYAFCHISGVVYGDVRHETVTICQTSEMPRCLRRGSFLSMSLAVLGHRRQVSEKEGWIFKWFLHQCVKVFWQYGDISFNYDTFWLCLGLFAERNLHRNSILVYYWILKSTDGVTSLHLFLKPVNF